MSGHAYLTFFADAPGESPAVGHEDWIELLSWSWGVTARAPSGGPGGAAAVAAVPADPIPRRSCGSTSSTRHPRELLGFVASGPAHPEGGAARHPGGGTAA